MNWTKEDLTKQVHEAKEHGMYELLHDAAQVHGLPFAFVLAIASRETNLRNIIGDGGHGIGIMQVDIRFHPIAKDAKESGAWKNHPKALIHYGVRLLRDNYQWAAETWPSFIPSQWQKIAASAYNCGRGNVRKSVAEGDCDRRTTGKDYGRDVMHRMSVFSEILEG